MVMGVILQYDPHFYTKTCKKPSSFPRFIDMETVIYHELGGPKYPPHPSSYEQFYSYTHFVCLMSISPFYRSIHDPGDVLSHLFSTDSNMGPNMSFKAFCMSSTDMGSYSSIIFLAKYSEHFLYKILRMFLLLD